MSNWLEILRSEIIDSDSSLRKHSLNQKKLRWSIDGARKMKDDHPREKKQPKQPSEVDGQAYHFIDSSADVPEGENVVLFDLHIKSNNSIVIIEKEAGI
jgi:hypothetical protein